MLGDWINVADRDLMIDQLLEKNPKTKIVLYGVDAWMFTGVGLSSNSYKLFYPFMDDEKVGEYIREEADFVDYFQHRWIRTSRYNEGLINSSFRGYLSNWDNYKFGVVDTLQLKKNIDSGHFRKINSTEENKAFFLKSIQKLNGRGIKVVLIYIPTISYYNQAEPEKFEELRKFFQELDQSSSEINYLEYLKDWDHRYELFFDPIHLNPEGQQALTNAILRDLKKIKHDSALTYQNKWFF